VKCDKHIEKNDDDFCYKCEELTLNEKKLKYENIICDSSLQRTDGDKKIGVVPFGIQETI
jgi:hypothetical protein